MQEALQPVSSAMPHEGASRRFPDLPVIGQPESYYAKGIHDADRRNDVYSHEVFKVGQYVTLALDPTLSWEDKLKYFRHCLRRHCQPPPYADEDVWVFYGKLADFVRQYCGQEALRMASQEDDMYAARVSMGQSREDIEDDAEAFFGKVLGSGDTCPDHFNQADWQQLKLIRDQWI